MPTWGTLLAFSLASLLLIAMPGPAVLFVIGRSLTLGRRGGLPSVLGNGLGGLPLVVAVALGVGTIVAESIVVFTVIKLLGAGYLIYLGVQAIRHRRVDVDLGDGRAAPPPASAARIVAQGVTVGVTNPKTIIFFVAALPQFVDFHAGAIAAQMVVLGSVFLLIGLVSDAVWAVVAGTARSWFATSPTRMARLRATGGGMMIGLGGALALAGNKV